MGILDSFIGGISGLFDPGRPYEAAMDEANKGWREARGYEEPYFKFGLEQKDRLNDTMKSLLNPEELQARWATGYETSPLAKRMLDINRQEGLEAASSMGLMGSSGAIQNIQRGAGDIVSKDREQFLKDLMDKYLAGVGLTRDIYSTGAGAGSNLSRARMGLGENLAGLAYGQEAAPMNMIMNILKLAAQAYGGGGMGSPSGAASI